MPHLQNNGDHGICLKALLQESEKQKPVRYLARFSAWGQHSRQMRTFGFPLCSFESPLCPCFVKSGPQTSSCILQALVESEMQNQTYWFKFCTWKRSQVTLVGFYIWKCDCKLRCIHQGERSQVRIWIPVASIRLVQKGIIPRTQNTLWP